MGLNKYLELCSLGYRLFRNGQLTFRKLATLTANGYAAALRRPTAGRSPSALILEPINTCNLRCTGCGFALSGALSGKVYPTASLTLESFKTIIDDVKDDLLFLVLENGGEPFLNPRLLEMVRYAYDQHVPTITSTNGDFPTGEAWGERIVTSGLDTLIVSISGHDNESHQLYHQRGHFDRVMANLMKITAAKRTLSSRHPEIVLRFIQTRQNVASVDIVRRAYKEWGVDKFDVRRTETHQFVYTKATDGKVDIKIHGGETKVYPNFCSNLYFIPDVLVDGTIYPCCFTYLFPPSLGNVLSDGGIKSVWNGTKYRGLREAMKKNRMAIPSCTACEGGLGYQGENWNRPLKFEISTPYLKGPAPRHHDEYDRDAAKAASAEAEIANT